MKTLKFLLSFSFVALLILGLSGCSDKPPKYDGEKAKVYGEKVGSYYGDKLKEAGAKNIREYLNKSQSVMLSLKQNIQNLNNEQIVEKIDDTIEQLINLSDEYLGITEEDYKFFINPLKYYGLYDDYDNFTQAAIGNSGPQMWHQLAYVIGINDDSWLKDYEAKKDILDTAIQIAKKEKLYFDIELDGYGKLKDKSREINNLLKEKDFKVINNTDVLGQTYGKTILEFEKMVRAKSKNDFKQKYRYIQWTERDLLNAKKYLAKKEEYLKLYPDSKWAKDDVKRYKNDVEKYSKKLKEAEKQFDKLYQADINKLEQQINKLNQLLKEKKTAQKHLQHNIKIFIKTFKTLLQQGYKDYTISKYLTNDGHTAYKKDILSINMNKNIKLSHLTGIAFDDYIEYIKKVLSENK